MCLRYVRQQGECRKGSERVARQHDPSWSESRHETLLFFRFASARIPYFPFTLCCMHPFVQMSRPLQVKPAGTDGRAGNVV